MGKASAGALLWRSLSPPTSGPFVFCPPYTPPVVIIYVVPDARVKERKGHEAKRARNAFQRLTLFGV